MKISHSHSKKSVKRTKYCACDKKRNLLVTWICAELHDWHLYVAGNTRQTCWCSVVQTARCHWTKQPLVLTAGWSCTHTLVEHVRLMTQGGVLTQMLSDHLHPLHLQPLQLLSLQKSIIDKNLYIPIFSYRKGKWTKPFQVLWAK